MEIGGPARQPIGHFEFCRKWPAECARIEKPKSPEQLAEAAWRTVRELNKRINRAVVARTDRDLYGREELWTFPVGTGDCEDFALQKRRLLINQYGLSPSNVLLTVVARRSGEGHAILTLRTTDGDYILDNLHPEVRPWTEAKEYKFIKRQSSEDAGKWVSIGKPQQSPVLLAGSKPSSSPRP